MIAAAIWQAERLGGQWAGIVIPGVIFATSFVLTWLLYKHFSRKH